MGLVGWVTSHTGLPAFYATGNGKLTADHPLLGAEFSRLIANVDGECLVADPGAAAGVPTTYRFGSQTVTLTRKGEAASGGSAHQFVTDSSGNVVAGVKLLGDDSREYETGAEIFTSALGRQIPRFPLGQPPPSGELEFSTVGAGTLVLRDLVASHAPLWVIHDEAGCQIPGCDIEGSRLVVAHRLREARSARRDVAQRNWLVDYSRVPTSLAGSGVQTPTGGPVVTWGQWEAWGKTHSPKGWQNWSALEVARKIAGML